VTNFEKLKSAIEVAFGFEPTQGQAELINLLCSFITSDAHNPVFILKGYAGTGKTTIVGSLVKALPSIQHKTTLLAPTGRASKVLGNYSGRQAYTIHKKIYRSSNDDFTGARFSLQANNYNNMLFIVDEASMISDLQSGESSLQNSLLQDLLTYVFMGDNCKLLFIGDKAQLPPVGLSLSHALDLAYLKKNFSLTIAEYELTEVMRQNKGSAILENATYIRNLLLSKPEKEIGLMEQFDLSELKLTIANEVKSDDHHSLQDAIQSSYYKYGVDDTIIITKSNKRANAYNQQIRARILDRDLETPITSSDLMMVVKNNYNWLSKESSTSFIANGDIIQIKRVRKFLSMHGFNFAIATVQMLDFPNDPEFECYLLLDTIMMDSPALTNDKNQELYKSVQADYADIENAAIRFKKMKEDPFLNALQVKFSYAITCHKAQGGQWQSVFVEQSYLPEKKFDRDYLRWIYTAFSRATTELHLIGFDEIT